MEENLYDDMLMVHMTIGQVKATIESVLKQSSIITSNQPEIIDLEELSKLIGYKKSTIYKLIHERKIPFHKPANGGRKIFFKTTEINQWLQSNRFETNEEFLENYKNRDKGKFINTIQIQQNLHNLRKLLQILKIFPAVFNNYKTRIQELEEKVVKYETDNQIIENLFNDEIINTKIIENEHKK